MKRSYGLWLAWIVLTLTLAASGCGDSGNHPFVDGDMATCDCSTTEDCSDGMVCDGCYCLVESDGDEGIPCLGSTDCPAGWICGPKDFCIQLEDGDVAEGDLPVDGDGSEVEGPNKCPKIVVSKAIVDFGAVQMGGYSKQSFRITNDSNFNANLQIDDIEYDDITQSDEFKPLTDLLTFPIILKRGESVTVEVEYNPRDMGKDEAELLIISNDCDNIITKVQLVSQYKGDAQICIEPAYFNYGNLDIGAAPITHTFRACHCGRVDGNKVLILSEIRMATGVNSPNFSIVDGTIDYLTPVILIPGAAGDPGVCHEFSVQYKPSIISAVDPHSEDILVVNTADTIADRVKAVRVEGTANATTLSVFPEPVDFELTVINTPEEPNKKCNTDEECPWGEICHPDDRFCYKDIPVSIYNWSPNAVWIQAIDLVKREGEGDTNCDEFKIDDYAGVANHQCITDADCQFNMKCLSQGPVNYCHLERGVSNAANFNVSFRPKDTQVEQCSLRVRSNLTGMNYMYFKVLGQGRPPNKIPVARASLQSHSTPIENVIEGESIVAPVKLCFYGNVSYDEDGSLEEFNWFWEGDGGYSGIPAGSAAYFKYLGTLRENVCVDFDVAGEYDINLKVRDNEYVWSEPFRITVKVRADQDLKVELRFDDCGGGSILFDNKVDMDLIIESPSGGTCYDGKLNNNLNCFFPNNEGQVMMTNYSNGVGDGANGGTTETSKLLNPSDGVWTISVKYVNCCAKWVDDFVVPICADECDGNNIRIDLFDPESTQAGSLCNQISASLDCGQTKSWRLARVNGLWVCPPLPM